MIYICSDNIYLQKGMEELLYPLGIKPISLDKYNEQALNIARTRSILLIDITIPSSVLLNTVYDNLDVIFLHNTPYENVSLYPFSAYFYTLHIGTSLEMFRMAIVNILSGKPREVMAKKKDRRLTVREEYVFRESLKGVSAQELSAACSIEAKSVYTHRKNACRKLGVNKITDVLPFQQFLVK
jgi:DNA-binding CsgD family transcriptional regulator